MQKLFEKGCNVSQRNLFYTTPLHLACQNDHKVGRRALFLCVVGICGCIVTRKNVGLEVCGGRCCAR